MNGNNMVLDTNIILYFLNGDETLLPLLEERNLIISVITEIELLSYNELSKEELEAIQGFIGDCTIVNLNDDIKEIAISIRKKHKIKLPDSIILATANSLNTPLITADLDFEEMDDPNIILYKA